MNKDIILRALEQIGQHSNAIKQVVKGVDVGPIFQGINVIVSTLNEEEVPQPKTENLKEKKGKEE